VSSVSNGFLVFGEKGPSLAQIFFELCDRGSYCNFRAVLGGTGVTCVADSVGGFSLVPVSRVGSSDEPGYCYLAGVAEDKKEEVSAVLGPAPTVDNLLPWVRLPVSVELAGRGYWHMKSVSFGDDQWAEFASCAVAGCDYAGEHVALGDRVGWYEPGLLDGTEQSGGEGFKMYVESCWRDVASCEVVDGNLRPAGAATKLVCVPVSKGGTGYLRYFRLEDCHALPGIVLVYCEPDGSVRGFSFVAWSDTFGALTGPAIRRIKKGVTGYALFQYEGVKLPRIGKYHPKWMTEIAALSFLGSLKHSRVPVEADVYTCGLRVGLKLNDGCGCSLRSRTYGEVFRDADALEEDGVLDEVSALNVGEG